MIVLDTNVLSEPLKSIPTPRVIESPDDQATDTLFMTAISHAELRFEVLKMPDGRHKNALAAKIEQVLDLFKNRTLDFDAAAADHLARITADCKKIGRPAMGPDTFIAAIVAVRDFAVATPNVRHFERLGISVINPWE